MIFVHTCQAKVDKIYYFFTKTLFLQKERRVMTQEKFERYRKAVEELKERKGYTVAFLAGIASEKADAKIAPNRMSNILSGKENGKAALIILAEIVFLYDLEA